MKRRKSEDAGIPTAEVIASGSGCRMGVVVEEDEDYAHHLLQDALHAGFSSVSLLLLPVNIQGIMEN